MVRRIFTQSSVLLVLLGWSMIILQTSLAYAQGAQNKRPPQAAYSACNGRSHNDDCTMRTPHGSMSGQCLTPRGQGGLVCVPAHHAQQSNRERSGGQNRPQGNNRRPMRNHTATQSDGIDYLYPATQAPITGNEYTSYIDGAWRVIKANGISDHKTGSFPNRGNPNAISEQSVDVRIPLNPVLTSNSTKVRIPGWLLNGVPFEPEAAEFYQGDRSSGWQYEALSGAVALGLDHNHAHVQPGGKYHYHGLPTLFLQKLGVKEGAHSPQIGWAADGFPIYALYGGKTSVAELKPSYRLKSGNRPSGANQPGGYYDGTFTKDYEYIEGLGHLDECNGTFTRNADYPNGTYAYFLTQDFPVIPRCLKGENISMDNRSVFRR